MNTIAIADTHVPTRFPKRFRSARMHINFDSGPGKMTPDEFWDFCADNRKLRAELTKEGDVIIMPPTGFETSSRNAEITSQLRTWAKADGSGIATDSNAGFVLPNGATYAPDAGWTSVTRLAEFTEEQRQRFLPECPDFLIELMSPSDSLNELQAKMEEYIENGLRLGWLIDPYGKKVHIYRPAREPEILGNPSRVSGEDVLPGFELDLMGIW